MTIARQLIEQGLAEGLKKGLAQGLEQGLEQGREQGLRSGARAVLLRLLVRRFGPLAADHQALVDGAELEQIERWTDRILEAKSIESLLDD